MFYFKDITRVKLSFSKSFTFILLRKHDFFYVFLKVELHFINHAISFTYRYWFFFYKIDIKGVQVLTQADHVGETWDLFFKQKSTFC